MHQHDAGPPDLGDDEQAYVVAAWAANLGGYRSDGSSGARGAPRGVSTLWRES